MVCSALERNEVHKARAIVLSFDNDVAALFAATVVRDFAPDVPIIASVSQVENVGRIQQAGADYALSVGQVAGQLLAHHVLGQTVSMQSRIKLVKLRPGRLTRRNPVASKVRERTGCTIVAVERGSEIITEFPPSFALAEGDGLYICGTTNAINRYYDEVPASHE